MVRSFTDEPIDGAVVERILDVARRGPSAGYSQGVEFVVVTDASTRAAIGRGFERIADTSGHPNYIAQAPVHVMLCVSAEIYRSRYREPDKMRVRAELDDATMWTVPYWYTDAGAAMLLMLLAAVDEGVGAAFVGFGPAEPRVRALLDVPDDYQIVGAVLLGNPAPDAKSLGDVAADPRPRRPIDEVVHRDRW